jgi:hypothetical protein
MGAMETALTLPDATDALAAAGLSQSSESIGASTARLEFESGMSRLVVGADFEATPQRLARARGYAARLPRLAGAQGAVRLALDLAPEANEVALAVVADREGCAPIPDWTALATPAGIIGASDAAWAHASDVAWWRGVLAGPATSLEEVMALPRTRLCVAGRFLAGVDARFTGEGAFGDMHPVHDVLIGLDILDVSGVTLNGMARYQIDIEGDPGDRPGLALKLAVGCVVRIGRPARVWFDERLAAAGGLAQVQTPVDLAAALDDLQRGDRGREIWKAGAACLSGLTPDIARAAFADAVTAAL